MSRIKKIISIFVFFLFLIQNVTASLSVKTAYAAAGPTNLKATTVRGKSVDLSWDAPSDNSSGINYEIYCNGKNVEEIAMKDCSLWYLEANTIYDIYVVAKYTDGSLSQESNHIKVTTLQDDYGDIIVNATPIQIGKLILGNIDFPLDNDCFSFTPAVSGDYSIKSIGKINTFGTIYDENMRYITCNNDDGGDRNFKIDINLTAGKTYYLCINDYDYSNIYDMSTGAYAFSVTLPDAEAPTAPTNVHVTERSSSTISLAWTSATDNQGVAYYEVYRNGAKVGNSLEGVNSFTDRNLGTSKKCTYTLKAIDVRDNSSVMSTAVSAVTLNGKSENGIYSPVGKNGQLKIVNGQLCNKYGQSFQLKGISSGGLQWYSNFMNYNSIKWLRNDWEANVIRLAMYTDENGYIYDPNIAKEVMKDIDSAIKLGMYVIVDWHISKDNNPNKYKTQAKTFFNQISAKYGKYPNLIYEICNEPSGKVTWKKDIKPYANEVIKVIRKNDKDNIILVGTGNGCKAIKDAANSPLTDKNVMYTFHFNTNDQDNVLKENIDYCLNKKIPIFVSQWYAAEKNNFGAITGKVKVWIDFLNSRNISWVNWSLSNSLDPWSALQYQASYKGGWSDNDLSDSGKLVRKDLRDEFNIF